MALSDAERKAQQRERERADREAHAEREAYVAREVAITKRLLDSFPVIGGSRELATPIPGGPPDPAEAPSGCSFRPRCPYAAEACEETPALREVVSRQSAACHFAPWERWPGPVAVAPKSERASSCASWIVWSIVSVCCCSWRRISSAIAPSPMPWRSITSSARSRTSWR